MTAQQQKKKSNFSKLCQYLTSFYGVYLIKIMPFFRRSKLAKPISNVCLLAHNGPIRLVSSVPKKIPNWDSPTYWNELCMWNPMYPRKARMEKNSKPYPPLTIGQAFLRVPWFHRFEDWLDGIKYRWASWQTTHIQKLRRTRRFQVQTRQSLIEFGTILHPRLKYSINLNQLVTCLRFYD